MGLERYALVGLTFSFIMILLNFYLIKKRKIDSSTFTLWFIICIIIGVFSLIPSIWFIVFKFVGTNFLLSAITVAGFFFLLIIIFYLHVVVNELKDKVLKLTVIVASSNLTIEKNNEKENN